MAANWLIVFTLNRWQWCAQSAYLIKPSLIKCSVLKSRLTNKIRQVLTEIKSSVYHLWKQHDQIKHRIKDTVAVVGHLFFFFFFFFRCGEILTLSILGNILSRRHFVIFFSYFIKITEFNNSCKVFPIKTICMECQVLFPGKNVTCLSSAD